MNYEIKVTRTSKVEIDLEDFGHDKNTKFSELTESQQNEIKDFADEQEYIAEFEITNLD